MNGRDRSGKYDTFTDYRHKRNDSEKTNYPREYPLHSCRIITFKKIYKKKKYDRPEPVTMNVKGSRY